MEHEKPKPEDKPASKPEATAPSRPRPQPWAKAGFPHFEPNANGMPHSVPAERNSRRNELDAEEAYTGIPNTNDPNTPPDGKSWHGFVY